MKGTLVDFLQMAASNASLTKDLVELAARYGFQFVKDELSDAALERVSGGYDTPTRAAIYEQTVTTASDPLAVSRDTYQQTITTVRTVNSLLYQQYQATLR